MKYNLLIALPFLMLLACAKKDESNPQVKNQTIVNQLLTNYAQLPEQAISVNLDRTVYAQYTMPTKKYGHGILGDKIEAEQLVVVVDGRFYEHTLQSEFVFEDIRPRLYDVDGDQQLEFITIRTHVSKGAGIVIYKIINEQLVEYANVEEIGTPFRWLNIVTIDDLDNDGSVEIAWIQTPHIGGILKIAKINAGSLSVLSNKSQYSNHAIGERNLCLSALTEQSNKKIFYVPNQNRTKIIGFSFNHNELIIEEDIDLKVDFTKTLTSQYNFDNLIHDEVNCINHN